MTKKLEKRIKDLLDIYNNNYIIMTDKEMNTYIEKAAAIVTEDGGMTSHAAIVGINLGKPVIVSAKNILSSVECKRFWCSTKS